MIEIFCAISVFLGADLDCYNSQSSTEDFPSLIVEGMNALDLGAPVPWEGKLEGCFLRVSRSYVGQCNSEPRELGTKLTIDLSEIDSIEILEGGEISSLKFVLNSPAKEIMKEIKMSLVSARHSAAGDISNLEDSHSLALQLLDDNEVETRRVSRTCDLNAVLNVRETLGYYIVVPVEQGHQMKALIPEILESCKGKTPNE